MKLALLGTGMIVTEVLPVLNDYWEHWAEGYNVDTTILDKAETLAKQYGLTQATSDYAKQALLAGKHVICEKPFTLHLEEFEELIKLAQEKELLLIEAIINQYLENFKVIKDSLSEIGDIKIVNINYSQYSSRYDAFKQGEIAPAFNPEMGGGAA